MSLPHRARVIRAKEEGLPAACVLRFVSPSEYLPVLKRVRAAFDVQGPKDGVEFARSLSGSGAVARAAAQWAIKFGRARRIRSRAPELCLRGGFVTRGGPRCRVLASFVGAPFATVSASFVC